MRESIGTVSLLNFIIFFILLIFAFLAGTLSYYKAYRINNSMVAAIEKYEGFNPMSYDEISNQLYSYGYEPHKITCAATVKHNGRDGYLVNKNGNKVTNTSSYNYGYCVYRYENDTIYKTKSGALATTDRYDSYEVITYMSFKFPVVQDILKLRVTSRTARIYYFSN